jgi:hypothetical protein
MANANFIKKKALFYQQIGLKHMEGNSEMLYFGHSSLWCRGRFNS